MAMASSDASPFDGLGYGAEQLQLQDDGKAGRKDDLIGAPAPSKRLVW
jgi:hypothetical protein